MFDSDLQAARHELRISPLDLWTHYFALGGNLDAIELDAYLTGLVDVGDLDHDLIAHALNEIYLDRGDDHPLTYFRS